MVYSVVNDNGSNEIAIVFWNVEGARKELEWVLDNWITKIAGRPDETVNEATTAVLLYPINQAPRLTRIISCGTIFED